MNPYSLVIIASVAAALSHSAVAAQPAPQANPAVCPLPYQNASAQAREYVMELGLEECLSKQGNRNFKRQGDNLTVPLAKGSVSYRDNRVDNDAYQAFRYGGYDAKLGLHLVNGFGYEWGWSELISHQSGEKYSIGGTLLPGSISPSANWVVFSATDGGGSSELYIRRLLADGHETPTFDISQAFDEANRVMPAAHQAKWLSDGQLQIDWICEQFSGAENFHDSTIFNWQQGQWRSNRVACQTSTNTSKAASANTTANNGQLVVGMSLDEVEQLFGRSADAYVVDPVSLFTKGGITRVWQLPNQQIKVTFVDDKVTKWQH